MLKVILNRLKPQVENIIAEEQASFREGHRLAVLQSKFSTLESSVKSTCSTNKIYIMYLYQEGFWQGMACNQNYFTNQTQITMAHS